MKNNNNFNFLKLLTRETLAAERDSASKNRDQLSHDRFNAALKAKTLDEAKNELMPWNTNEPKTIHLRLLYVNDALEVLDKLINHIQSLFAYKNRQKIRFLIYVGAGKNSKNFEQALHPAVWEFLKSRRITPFDLKSKILADL